MEGEGFARAAEGRFSQRPDRPTAEKGNDDDLSMDSGSAGDGQSEQGEIHAGPEVESKRMKTLSRLTIIGTDPFFDPFSLLGQSDRLA